jgi:hypothetical protein
LDCGTQREGSIYFKFENMWVKFEGFVEQVNLWWASYEFHGLPSYVLSNKLKALKVDLKKWKEVFGDVGKKKDELLEGIRDSDCIDEGRGLLEEERMRRTDMTKEFEKTLLFEEINWRQKSRILWLKEGDNNMKFFHRMTNSHRRYNHVESLRINGAMSNNSLEIKEHIVYYYNKLYTEQSTWRPRVDGLSFSSIDAKEGIWLEGEFEEQEVWEVVRNLKVDKASGPDGSTMAFFFFFLKRWDILKQDIMAVLSEFHNRHQFEKSCNATFVSLIPKKTEAADVKDFRSMSLVGWVYKLISKVLANKFKLVLGKIISSSQNAFIGGWQILDSILIVNECLDSRIRSGEAGLLCKLDLEKSYDHVNWDFLLYMLQRCGFGEKWRRDWIDFFIATVRFSILVNSTPFGFFTSSSGLRQGDPLSPLSFVVVMEALSRMLIATMNQGLLIGFSMRFRDNEELVVNHMLFADDTLLFCGDQAEYVQNLQCIFLCFEAASRLKINLGKSELVPIGEVENVDNLAHILGRRVASLPMTYLGLPLGVSFKATSIWNGVIEKVEDRLASWKKLYMSKSGRLTLIKCIISNIPTYYLSLFPIPMSVAKRLERLQRNFLWSGIGDEVKFHLVKMTHNLYSN